jgi:hypothetical protein
VTPNDYVHLGCVADVDDGSDAFNYFPPPKPPALETYVLTNQTPEGLNLTACASAAKRAGKRFFGLKPRVCRAGGSLISALRHSARAGRCQALCEPDGTCRSLEEGGRGSWDPASTSLYVLKTGKGECSVVGPHQTTAN